MHLYSNLFGIQFRIYFWMQSCILEKYLYSNFFAIQLMNNFWILLWDMGARREIVSIQQYRLFLLK